MAQQSDIGPWPPVQVSRHVLLYGERLSAPPPTPNLEGQVPVFITPGDRVVYLRTPLGTGQLGTPRVPFGTLTIILSP